MEFLQVEANVEELVAFALLHHLNMQYWVPRDQVGSGQTETRLLRESNQLTIGSPVDKDSAQSKP